MASHISFAEPAVDSADFANSSLRFVNPPSILPFAFWNALAIADIVFPRAIRAKLNAVMLIVARAMDPPRIVIELAKAYIPIFPISNAMPVMATKAMAPAIAAIPPAILNKLTPCNFSAASAKVCIARDTVNIITEIDKNKPITARSPKTNGGKFAIATASTVAITTRIATAPSRIPMFASSDIVSA